MDADKKNLDRRFPDLTAETSDDETQKGKVKKFLRNKSDYLYGRNDTGTSFGMARECLETLGCCGNGKSKRFAEIIAATAMAGEISLMTSIVNGTYIYAHETFGRNRPAQ